MRTCTHSFLRLIIAGRGDDPPIAATLISRVTDGLHSSVAGEDGLPRGLHRNSEPTSMPAHQILSSHGRDHPRFGKLSQAEALE